MDELIEKIEQIIEEADPDVTVEDYITHVPEDEDGLEPETVQ